MYQPPCPFERAILSTAFVCGTSQRQYIAEKEAVLCTEPAARQRCKQLIGHLRRCAGFALPRLQAGEQLPHGQEMKLKAGGLTGIRTLLDLGDTDTRDIRFYLDTLLARYDQIDAIPCEHIVRSIQSYRTRRDNRTK